ncbi:MAG: hypothetical protein FWG85_01700 [Bacteroidetes bacterium]|nr:hypothetical protein [Bacteroidota bacterium]
MKKYICYIIVLVAILLNSCIQENDALVYPPLIVETVNIRYFNIHNDEISRSVLLDRKSIGNNIPFNSVAKPETPPYDSSTIQVLKNDNITYRSKQKFKFARKSNYIMIALPDYRIMPDSIIKYDDTIAYLQTTILTPEDTNQCFVKFLNANPDTSINYSIKIGCPNGQNLFVDNEISTVSYLQSTGIQPVYEGIRVISVIKNYKNADTNSPSNSVVGIYELDLKRLGQYALIMNKNDELFFVDELDHNSPFIKLNNVEARNAYIRVVNFASDNVTINSSTQGDITANLNANFIDDYRDITTCDVLSLDRITLEANGNTTDTIFMSFDIYKKYSIFAFDTDNQIAGKIIGIPPIDDRMKTNTNQAIVRVVNGNIEKNGITVSIGAKSFNNDIGYESGITLAVNLLAGEYSEPMYINAGTIIPISVFASTQPTQYMFSAVLNIENGKEYIIAVDKDSKIAAIEINDEAQTIQYGEEASFLQIFNACNGNNNLNFTIPNLITNGKLPHSNLLTTFIPVGENNINANNKTINFNSENNIRTLLIAASNYNEPTLFAIQSPNMGASNSSFRFRFINASDDTPQLLVRDIVKETITQNRDTIFIYDTLNTNIAYQTASFINSYSRDRKYTFDFVSQNADGETKLYKAKDINFTLNKNYSIIFYGNKNIGYKIFIVQEY